ncbi:MAG TPA: VOC family protein [Syntrophomonas sp.]|nr:VOC family protein [Syntrophomonas sp.]
MMTFAQLGEHNGDRQFNQISFMVHDMQNAIDRWIEGLKVGPWIVCEITEADMQNLVTKNGAVNPEKFKMKLALAYMGSVQIELIQPCYGMPVYQDFLDKYGEGIHHFKETFNKDENYDAALADYVERGFPVIFGGDLWGTRFSYMETRPDFNFVFEMGNMAAASNIPEGAVYMYPDPAKE